MNKRSISSPEIENSQAEKSRRMDAKDFTKAMKSMETTMMTTMSQSFAGVNQTLAANGTSLKNIEETLSALLVRVEKNEKELESLRNDFMELEARFNEREQNDLSNHFRFTGMPAAQVAPEGQLELLLKMCSFVGVPTTKNDFDYFRMYNTRNNSSGVITGRFTELSKRREVFKAFKEKMKTSEITWKLLFPDKADGPNAMRKLGLFSSLTKYTMNLKAKARETGKFAYVWETEGRVLLRVKEGEKSIRVKSPMELQRAINQII